MLSATLSARLWGSDPCACGRGLALAVASRRAMAARKAALLEVLSRGTCSQCKATRRIRPTDTCWVASQHPTLALWTPPMMAACTAAVLEMLQGQLQLNRTHEACK